MSFLRKLSLGLVAALLWMPLSAHAQSGAQPSQAQLRVVALGDSLTAGYGLQGGEDFASQLQAALVAKGHNVKIENAGVSGDTSAGGLARLEWATGGDPKPRLVIVTLGGNDLLRGVEPAITKSNLQKILQSLKDRGIPALLVGMRAPNNLGPVYQRQFDALYPDLARDFDVPLYAFFLDGVAMNPRYNLPDGLHPTKEGIGIIVGKIMPTVVKALQRP